MTIKAKRKLNHLEIRAAKPRPKDILEGVNSHSCIPSQFTVAEREEMRPHELHAMIRKAQEVRMKSLNDVLGRYKDDFITLTAPEKNFVYVYEKDVKNGILRDTVNDTFMEVARLLSEQMEESENAD